MAQTREPRQKIGMTLIAGIAFLVMAVVMAGAVAFARSATADANRRADQQAELKQLGITLADASDYLTDRARMFVVTGDQRYLDEYWYEIETTQSRDMVITRLREIGIPQAEFDLLDEAKANSDALVNTEARAMRLMLEADGVEPSDMPAAIADFELSAADQQLSAAEKREVARTIMFDDTYAADKSIIMGPIAEFQETMNSRIAASAAGARHRANQAIRILVALAVAIPIGMLGGLWLFRSRIEVPITRYTRALRERDQHDENFELAVAGTRELQELGAAFNRQFHENQHQVQQNGELVQELTALVSDVTQRAQDVGDVGTRLGGIVSDTNSSVRQIAQTTQDVAAGAQTVASANVETLGAFEQLATAIDAVARGATEQGSTLQRAVELTQVIAERNRQVAQSAQQGLAEAKGNAEQAVAGNAIVQRTVRAMTEVRERVDLAASRVVEMGERSKQISSIVSVIEDLTEQTNLLALNAAIEAARAGDAGKGFAVVAEEVRKLAERSSASTQEIDALVRGVLGSVDDAVSAMQEGTRGVDTMASESEAARLAFDGILQRARTLEERTNSIVQFAEEAAERSRDLQSQMEDTSAIAEENSAAATEMSAISGSARRDIQRVGAATEQNAAGAEELRAATDEAAEQLDQVNGLAQSLELLAIDLQERLTAFGVSDSFSGGAAGAAPAQATRRQPGWNGRLPESPTAPSRQRELTLAGAPRNRSV